MTVEFLLGKMLLIDQEIKLLRDKLSEGEIVNKKLQDEIKRWQDRKRAVCHQFGIEYACNYGGNNGLVEMKEDHASKVIQCNLDQMIQECEIEERRMKTIMQNGNSGLNYFEEHNENDM